jgi:glycosyltransferase involved in cell wall biosynthesis
MLQGNFFNHAMRILISSPNLKAVGGVAAFHRTLRPYFIDYAGYHSFGANQNSKLAKRLTEIFREFLNYIKQLRSSEYSLVLLNPSFRRRALIRDAIYLIIAKVLRNKIVVFFHGWDPHIACRVENRWLWAFKLTFLQCDAFIVLASEYRQKLADMGFSKPLICETTAVPDEIFKYPRAFSIHRNKVREPFPILFLARIEKEKGAFLALDAYAGLKRRYPNAFLTIAGEGSALDALKIRALKMNVEGVSFTGHLEGAAKWQAFRQACCYLLPTYGEGMPTSALEAMAFGLPVITRPVGGIADFFLDGKMGFMTNSLEPCAFEERLERLLLDPAKGCEMGLFNISFAHEHFAASHVAQRLKNIFATL